MKQGEEHLWVKPLLFFFFSIMFFHEINDLKNSLLAYAAFIMLSILVRDPKSLPKIQQWGI